MKLLLIIYIKDVVKCNLKILGVNVDDWETVTGDRSGWRRLIWEGYKNFQRRRIEHYNKNRVIRKGEIKSVPEI